MVLWSEILKEGNLIAGSSPPRSDPLVSSSKLFFTIGGGVKASSSFQVCLTGGWPSPSNGVASDVVGSVFSARGVSVPSSVL